jgi:hypothetical protein
LSICRCFLLQVALLALPERDGRSDGCQRCVHDFESCIGSLFLPCCFYDNEASLPLAAGGAAGAAGA